MAEREPGFYWVNLRWAPERTDWTIAKWTGAGWWAVGINDRLDDQQFTEIGERVERRITIDLSDKTLPPMTLTPEGIAGPEGIAAHDLTKPAAQMPDFIFGGITIPSMKSMLEAMGKTVILQGWPEPSLVCLAQLLRLQMDRIDPTEDYALAWEELSEGSRQYYLTIAEGLRMALVGWPEPQPITDAQKTGEWWLVWFSAERNGQWIKARWFYDAWYADGSRYPLARHLVSVCLPLPPDVKP